MLLAIWGDSHIRTGLSTVILRFIASLTSTASLVCTHTSKKLQMSPSSRLQGAEMELYLCDSLHKWSDHHVIYNTEEWQEPVQPSHSNTRIHNKYPYSGHLR